MISGKPNMPPVIIDTNILIRALLRPKNSDGKIFEQFMGGKFIIYFSPDLISEITRVLTYSRIVKKYHLTQHDINEFIKAIMTFGKLMYTTKKIEGSRDKDDNELLSLAYTLYTNTPVILITADQDLLVLKRKYAWLTIQTPQEFLKKSA